MLELGYLALEVLKVLKADLVLVVGLEVDGVVIVGCVVFLDGLVSEGVLCSGLN